ncbi:Protein cbp3, mitochondrial [Orbilia oligospora]|uniref:Protein cbp3, mitochondrial n=1 Tax=Orbilia oligospora TaxID=2813651 RepID=A0A6G1LZW5_ORBOL|nr:Protein cbp3, mitochondrial [Orbilia oligospora]KAF3211788.1 Protein cbp3, mitochondrial [Orbilia oligospora]KAF3220959.1 Protein cbp3, mitochondrial [Orbilia oligospora]KAF3221944.1 Protein cbp3, mitochondrial [Orbilia oligospora]KAF3240063.1 Protein cbp3, mitochondrial [Orbilia oligospora]
MSLIEPILPSLRAGLSQSIRHVARPQSVPPSPLRGALKRKITPLPASTSANLQRRSFVTSSRLQYASDPKSSEPEGPTGIRAAIAKAVSKVLPDSTKEQYYSYQKSEELYKECRLQGEYYPGEPVTGKAKFWYEECGMAPCLRNWSSISNLHVWLIMVRFRNMAPRARAKMWQQAFINHYFFDLEAVLTDRHKVTNKSKRQKMLKELYEHFQYTILSYDEAFIRGDAWMAAAIWQNVFLMREDMDFRKLAMVVSYVRRILSGLEKLDEETILTAQVYFGNPLEEATTVDKFTEELPNPSKKKK